MAERGAVKNHGGPAAVRVWQLTRGNFDALPERKSRGTTLIKVQSRDYNGERRKIARI